ncbi:MAG: hypothetical protein ACT4P6_10890 [Gemmatimonadaceae bacterium]
MLRKASATLVQAAESLGLSARGHHRVLRIARTVADLEGDGEVDGVHIANVQYRSLGVSRMSV